MNQAFVWALSALCLAMFVNGLLRPGRCYEFPFLAGATFIGFILPQVFSLADDPYLDPVAVGRTLFFTILCAAMCWLGWTLARAPLRSALKWEFDERRLLIVAAVLSVAGAWFYYKIGRLPEEVRASTLPTGSVVIFLFFAQLTIFGFATAMLCLARRPTWFALGIVLFDSIFIVERVLATGKRGEFLYFGMSIVLAVWFQRRLAVPRPVVVLITMMAVVALSSAEDYREVTGRAQLPDWSQVAEIDVIGNFTKLLESGAPEMRNAVERMDFTQRTQAFDFGLAHWNIFVYTFVPSQIVGASMKNSLLIEAPIGGVDRHYNPEIGSTETGMTDAFASFWYFGALKFFVIAFIMAKLYRTAMQGWALPQLIYMISITAAMHTITHFTHWIFTSWFTIAVLLVPALMLARVRSAPGVVDSEAGRGPEPAAPATRRLARSRS